MLCAVQHFQKIIEMINASSVSSVKVKFHRKTIILSYILRTPLYLFTKQNKWMHDMAKYRLDQI